jgi:hypothetical protein
VVGTIVLEVAALEPGVVIEATLAEAGSPPPAA